MSFRAAFVVWRDGVRAAFKQWKADVRRDWQKVKDEWRAMREGKRKVNPK